jgi:hypothetical protein
MIFFINEFASMTWYVCYLLQGVVTIVRVVFVSRQVAKPQSVGYKNEKYFA